MTGRNEPCPCGSGKKYKKCCISANTSSFQVSYSNYLNDMFQVNNVLPMTDYFNKMNNTVSNLYYSMGHIRKQIINFALEALEKLPQPKKVIIFGPGLCNDIPLEFLAGKFDIITLVDIDIRSVNKAVSKLPFDLRSKCIIQQVDFSGLEKLISLLLTNINTYNDNELEMLMDSAYEEYTKLVMSPSSFGLSESYDLVISSCVSTQLVSPYFRNILGNRINKNIARKIAKFANQAALKHCQLLRNCCMDSGYCILASDILEWGYKNRQPIGLARAIPMLPSKMTIHDVVSYYSKYEDFRIVGSGIIANTKNYFMPIVTRSWIWEIENNRFTNRLYLVIGTLLKPITK